MVSMELDSLLLALKISRRLLVSPKMRALAVKS